jgi:hypothetical protein
VWAGVVSGIGRRTGRVRRSSRNTSIASIASTVAYLVTDSMLVFLLLRLTRPVRRPIPETTPAHTVGSRS